MYTQLIFITILFFLNISKNVTNKKIIDMVIININTAVVIY